MMKWLVGLNLADDGPSPLKFAASWVRALGGGRLTVVHIVNQRFIDRYVEHGKILEIEEAAHDALMKAVQAEGATDLLERALVEFSTGADQALSDIASAKSMAGIIVGRNSALRSGPRLRISLATDRAAS